MAIQWTKYVSTRALAAAAERNVGRGHKGWVAALHRSVTMFIPIFLAETFASCAINTEGSVCILFCFVTSRVPWSQASYLTESGLLCAAVRARHSVVAESEGLGMVAALQMTCKTHSSARLH